MRICSLDSSGLVASVAIINDGIMEAEYSIQYKITHSQTLLPMLDEVCKRIELGLDTIDAYAVAAGPGSFTGLRIGAATVKGLGIAVDRPVVAIPTLEALAFNAYGAQEIICPIMDARRHQVYTGIYSFEPDEVSHGYQMKVIEGQQACVFEELCEKLNEIGRPVLFIGDGIPVYEGEMNGLLTVPYIIAPAHIGRQRAGSVASLASLYLSGKADGLEGVVTSTDDMSPIYLRLSQAEREKKEREGDA